MFHRTITTALLAVGIAVAAPATAWACVQPPEKPPICHPVNGHGETGTGWNIISPARASSHIDESKYPDGIYWKHVSSDGRHDVYAVDGKCPGTPTPTETTPNPTETTPTPTETTPTPTETTTPNPTETTPAPTRTTPAPVLTTTMITPHGGVQAGDGSTSYTEASSVVPLTGGAGLCALLLALALRRRGAHQ